VEVGAACALLSVIGQLADASVQAVQATGGTTLALEENGGLSAVEALSSITLTAEVTEQSATFHASTADEGSGEIARLACRMVARQARGAMHIRTRCTRPLMQGERRVAAQTFRGRSAVQAIRAVYILALFALAIVQNQRQRANQTLPRVALGARGAEQSATFRANTINESCGRVALFASREVARQARASMQVRTCCAGLLMQGKRGVAHQTFESGRADQALHPVHVLASLTLAIEQNQRQRTVQTLRRITLGT